MIKKNTRNIFKWYIILLIFTSIGYCCGIITFRYKSLPYGTLKTLCHAIKSEPVKYKKNRNIKTAVLDKHFIDPLSTYEKTILPEVLNNNDLNVQISSLLIELNDFYHAYNNIEILSSQLDGNIFRLDFKYYNLCYSSYAYFKSVRSKKKCDTAINIIPGSGLNQSSAMFYNDPNNYQSNIDDIAVQYGDVYLYVKPNEDFLAIHRNGKKIGTVSYVNFLLNKGSSYSALYIIQSIALSKYLKNKYKKLYICGLSQGGAALLISLQSKPDRALIASGFSVLFDYPYRSNHGQIIIPGYRKYYTSIKIKQIIKNTKTNFLFTYGIMEKGVYGLDAKEKLTLRFFDDMNNVKVLIHQEGHVYNESIVHKFFK